MGGKSCFPSNTRVTSSSRSLIVLFWTPQVKFKGISALTCLTLCPSISIWCHLHISHAYGMIFIKLGTNLKNMRGCITYQIYVIDQRSWSQDQILQITIWQFWGHGVSVSQETALALLGNWKIFGKHQVLKLLIFPLYTSWLQN